MHRLAGGRNGPAAENFSCPAFMSAIAPITAPRASAVRFELPAPLNREVIIPPPSMDQIAACLRLDPKSDGPAETPRERIIRLHRQAQILLGPDHASLTGELQIAQVAEMVQALYLAGNGVDPANFVQCQRYLREQRDSQRSAEDLLEDIETLSVGLGAELKITPAQAAQMPIADAVSLRNRLAEAATAEAKFDAALHDKELR